MVQLCSTCKPKGWVSAQAFTTFECPICKQTMVWPNLKTPVACNDCATQQNLCQRCGETITDNEVDGDE